MTSLAITKACYHQGFLNLTYFIYATHTATTIGSEKRTTYLPVLSVPARIFFFFFFFFTLHYVMLGGPMKYAINFQLEMKISCDIRLIKKFISLFKVHFIQSYL